MEAVNVTREDFEERGAAARQRLVEARLEFRGRRISARARYHRLPDSSDVPDVPDVPDEVGAEEETPEPSWFPGRYGIEKREKARARVKRRKANAAALDSAVNAREAVAGFGDAFREAAKGAGSLAEAMRRLEGRSLAVDPAIPGSEETHFRWGGPEHQRASAGLRAATHVRWECHQPERHVEDVTLLAGDRIVRGDLVCLDSLGRVVRTRGKTVAGVVGYALHEGGPGENVTVRCAVDQAQRSPTRGFSDPGPAADRESLNTDAERLWKEIQGGLPENLPSTRGPSPPRGLSASLERKWREFQGRVWPGRRDS